MAAYDIDLEMVQALVAAEIGYDGVTNQRIGDVTIVDREIRLPGFEQDGFDLGPEQVQVAEILIEPVDVEMHFLPVVASGQRFRGMKNPDSGSLGLKQ
ncbi:hypothetical protein AJ88_29985 [Mesorhizobium amorphae CCBAU 01583]|nr:hypothetical protein AJ88_29985 [Mesorhizobium amorphae CCBAU 01583]